jgi:hypothetical protein
LEISRRTWEDNIKIGVKEAGFEGLDWTEYTVQWRVLLDTIIKLQILYEMLESHDKLSDYQLIFSAVYYTEFV